MPGKNRLLAKLINIETGKTNKFDSDNIRLHYNKVKPGVAAMSVYAHPSYLPASAVTGEQALVTSNNRFYVFNNGGWYSVGGENRFSPVFATTPAASYELSKTGGTTVITVLATDSDDVPIIYTAVADSGFNAIATITHDSDKHNVWTVTPKDSENGTAVGGTGTITFKASDGINLVSASASTFTISFSVADSSYTTFLVKADSTGTDSQVDASSNTYTLTETGDTTSHAFTPLHPGGYSVEFNSTDASIAVPAATGSEYRLGPDAGWTLEVWLYSIDFSQAQIVYLQRNQQDARGTVVSIATNGAITFYQGDANNSAWEVQMSCGTLTAHTWTHLAIVRNGSGTNNYKTYLNGTQQAQATYASSSANRQVAGYIGGGNSSYNSDNREFVGYMRDFRYTESAVYTSNFTAPTKPLTVLSDTKLLYFNGEAYIVDKCSVYGQPTVTTNVLLERNGPYDYTAYDKTEHGGAVDFKNGANYFTAPFSVTGVDPITCEAWIYMNALSTHNVIYCQYPNSNPTAYGGRHIFYVSSGTGKLQYWTGADGASSHPHVLRYKQWYHVAYVKTGTTVKLYVNGDEAVGSQTHDVSIFNENIQFGAIPENSGYFDGFIFDLRITYNNTTYTGDFTPPTAPLTSSSDTKVLTMTNKNDIWEVAKGSKLSDIGTGPSSSNTQRKWTDSSAIHFNGSTGNYLYLDMEETFGTRDFTIEAWVYAESTAGSGVVQISPTSGTGLLSLGSAGSVGFGQQNGYWRLYTTGGWPVTGYLQSSTAVVVDTWHHLAAVKTGGNTKLYLNGTEIATRADTYDYSTTRYMAFGCANANNYVWPGYVQDLRVAIGYARYTSNFTAPTSTFSA